MHQKYKHLSLEDQSDLGLIPIKNFDLPEKIMRSTKSSRTSKNKKILGTSIDERPDVVKERQEFRHWEIDTIVGKKPVLMELQKTRNGKDGGSNYCFDIYIS